VVPPKDVFTLDWLCHEFYAFNLFGLEDLDFVRNDLLLGPAAKRTCIIALDPTFGSFILLELVSLVKVFKLFRLERIFLVFKV
jgi:hypothetical protein